MVEFHQGETGITIANQPGLWSPIIVEYKKGKPKQDECDLMQLVAEVMALEETLNTSIEQSYLFYHQIRRRQKVEITQDMRQKVRLASQAMMEHFREGSTFDATPSRKCRSCSLNDYCLPRITKRRKKVANYLKEYIQCEN